MDVPFYESNLVPAVPNVQHGYKNIWLRDMWYVGLCSNEQVKERAWSGVIDILDRYKWKLEIHAKQRPVHHYEFIHVRYDPNGYEIEHEHWLHNQFDAIANAGEIALDAGRNDLAELILDYLITCDVANAPAAGMYEDRNCLDAYTLGCVMRFLRKAEGPLHHRHNAITYLKKGCYIALDSLLPFATPSKTVCLSLLGLLWPCKIYTDYRWGQIVALVTSQLMREPFGFIRYESDSYDGEHFGRGKGTETPWLLGDLFLAYIDPNNPLWMKRLDLAYKHFGMMPEGYFPENMKPNRNSPLVWAQSMYDHLKRS